VALFHLLFCMFIDEIKKAQNVHKIKKIAQSNLESGRVW